MLARIFTNTVSFLDLANFKIPEADVRIARGWRYEPCDLAVLYGLLNPNRTARQGLLRNEIYARHQGPLIVIESSILGRVFTPRSLPPPLPQLGFRFRRPRQSHPYFRVGLNGGLGDDADFGPGGNPPDRWERMSRELDLKLKPYRTTGEHILLIGQTHKDASLRGMDMADWLSTAAIAIRKVSDRPIVLRMHPSVRLSDWLTVTRRMQLMPDVTIAPRGRGAAEDLANAWCCVTYSSGFAVDALMAGIPTIAVSPASLAWPICSKELAEVENPKMPAREQWLYDLAYAQWSLAELSDGTAWRHISRSLALTWPG